MLNRPAGRGTVRLSSADPEAAPVIDPRYGSCQADIDAIVSGLRTLREIAEQPDLASWRGEELCPGPAVQSLDELRAYVRATLSTIYHPVGTCKMGIDELAVVDPALRVRGIDGLRIADASVMPTITSANTHAPTVMIAERLAELHDLVHRARRSDPTPGPWRWLRRPGTPRTGATRCLPIEPAALTLLEGRHVSVALSDGSRIDDCQLVSAGRHHVRSLWLFTGGEDTFVPLDDVVDLWECDRPRVA